MNILTGLQSAGVLLFLSILFSVHIVYPSTCFPSGDTVCISGSARTARFKTRIPLNGSWKALLIQGDSEILCDLNVPFLTNEYSAVKLIRSFRLDSFPGPMYLYCDGMQGSADIFVNGALIFRKEDVKKGIFLPLSQGVVQTGWNQIVIDLKNAVAGDFFVFRNRKNEENNLVGIYKTVFLLSGSGMGVPAGTDKAITKEQIDISAVYDPWAPGIPCKKADSAACRVISELYKYNVRKIYFTLNPPEIVYDLCDSLGLIIADKLPAGGKIVFYNHFPSRRFMPFFTMPLWVDSKGIMTDFYGKIYPQDYAGLNNQSLIDARKQLLIISLFSILLLVLLKFINFSVYSQLWHHFFHRRITIATVSHHKLIDVWLMGLLHLLKWMILSLVLVNIFILPFCIYPYYLPEESKLARFFDFVPYLEEVRLHALFLSVFLFMFTINTLKYFLIFCLEKIWNQRKILIRYLEYSATIHFPFLFFFLPYCFFSSLFQDTGIVVFFVLNIILLLVFALYRWFMLISGLSEIYRLKPILIFLYLCTFEFIPLLVSYSLIS